MLHHLFPVLIDVPHVMTGKKLQQSEPYQHTDLEVVVGEFPHSRLQTDKAGSERWVHLLGASTPTRTDNTQCQILTGPIIFQ